MMKQDRRALAVCVPSGHGAEVGEQHKAPAPRTALCESQSRRQQHCPGYTSCHGGGCGWHSPCWVCTKNPCWKLLVWMGSETPKWHSEE